MTEQAPIRPTRFPLWFWAAMFALFLLLVGAIGLYLRSAHFEEVVRARVVGFMERATGGRVDLESLTWNMSRLEIEARNLTIHGLEPPNDVPYAHADRLLIRLRVVSIFNAKVDLSYVALERPAIHLIVNPDGSTNIPEPKVKSTSKLTPVEQLFDLAIGHADVRDGSLLLNQRKLPLDFSVSDIAAAMTYEAHQKRYDGTLHLGKMDARYQDFRDVPALADAEFSLWSNRAEIKSLKLISQRSAVQLSALIEDFNHPQVEVTYSGNLDIAQLGEIARVYPLRSGTAVVSGTGRYSAENYTSAGKLNFKGVNYDAEGLSLRDASASTEFSLDRDHVLLKRIDARVLGGTVTGEAEVRNYAPGMASRGAQLSNERPRSAAKPSAEGPRTTLGNLEVAKAGVLPVPQGSANLALRGGSLAEVVRILSSRSLPLDQLNAVGLVDGTVRLTWRESISRGIAELALNASAPSEVRAGQLPVSGTLQGRYLLQSGLLDFSTLNLNTPHIQASASGQLGNTATLKLSVNATSLAELQPLLAAMGQPALPVEIDGHASFNGTVNGQLHRPEIAGHLQATNVTYLYADEPVPAAVHPAEPAQKSLSSLLHLGQSEAPPVPQPAVRIRRIPVDSFAGDVQYAHDLLALHNGMVQQGSAHLSVDGSATLQNGALLDSSPFHLQAAMHNGNLADLQKTAALDYPIAGLVNFKLDASGTVADPHAQGQWSVSGGEIYGRYIQALRSSLVFANHEARFEDIYLEAVGGVVTGLAAYNLSTHEHHSDLQGDRIALEKIPELQTAVLQEKGVASFRVKTSGRLDSPVVDAHVEISNLMLNDEYSGSLVADARSHGSVVEITARSRFPNATLSIDGTVDLRGDLQSDLQMQFSQVNIDPLLRAELRSRVTGHSALVGHGTLSGPLRRPRTLKGSLKVDAFSIEVDKVPIRTDGPLEITLADGVVKVERMTLMAEGTNLTIAGSVDSRGDRPVNLVANGRVNLALLHTIDSDVTSYGLIDIDATVSGTLDKPVMTGRIAISKAGFSVIDMPAGLGDLNGTLVFNQNRLEVEKLTGRVGGGMVTFAGNITYGGTLGFDLTAQGTDIRFRYGGVSLTADQSLRLAGTLASSTLTGDITITRFAQVPSVEVANAFASQTLEVPNPRSPLNNLRLDVHIMSAPELTVQTSLAKLSGDADLRLRGTAIRPNLLGRVNIAEGDINVNGTKYHLDRGDITFANPVRIDPILDIEATTRVRDFDITIGLHGTIEKLTTTYRSDPPLSSDDIIALLAFGRTQEEGSLAGSSPSSLGEGASGLLLGQAINQTVSNRVSKLFGVSAIRINPSIGGADNNPSARLTIEQQVSKDVTLTYITNLTQAAQQVIQFEYNINAQYTLQAIRDENGVVSVDLLVRKRRK